MAQRASKDALNGEQIDGRITEQTAESENRYSPTLASRAGSCLTSSHAWDASMASGLRVVNDGFSGSVM